MPRENRKRGKKHKASKQTSFHEEDRQPEQQPEPQVGPSWIVSHSASGEDLEINPEAPFGYVDANIKAYFRTVDMQIRDWQENQGEQESFVGDGNLKAEKHMFFVAALTEMRGKEKQLATDPDCSIILERMAYSMDDFVRRVFLDSLSGSYETLVKHRFASHVCQTLFTVVAETIARETTGIIAPAPDSSEGKLLTSTDIILDICKELLPSISSLLMDPFASHVIRALLGLLCPSSSSSSNRASSDEPYADAARSKKSANWKSRQGPLGSVFINKDKGKAKEVIARRAGQTVPPEFRAMARSFVDLVRNELGDNEVRALAADKVACPSLLMLLNVEAELGMADEQGSLMDRVTVGAVSISLNKDTASISLPPSDYLGTFFRDPTSSHLLETVLSIASNRTFTLLWNTYFKGGTKLSRLAVHPVGNFVVAKALERVDKAQLEGVYEELGTGGIWEKMLATSRTGVLRAAIDRSVALRSSEESAIKASFSVLNLASGSDLDGDENKEKLVMRLLGLKALEGTISTRAAKDFCLSAGPEHEKKSKKTSSFSRTSIQGSLLLQSLLKLSSPHNQPVIDSLSSLDPSSSLLSIAQDPTASRVLDVLLDSETVPKKVKREFVQNLIGNYHLLLDDRVGSRVGDRCWAFADTYLKEKIARSLIPHEHALAGSYYGRYFSRNLNLGLLKRRPEEWKTVQARKKAGTGTSSTTIIATTTTTTEFGIPIPSSEPSKPIKPTPELSDIKASKKRKRAERVKDEIDELFDYSRPKKKKKEENKNSIGPSFTGDKDETKVEEKKPVAAGAGIPVDKGTEELKDILDATRAAPKIDYKAKRRVGKRRV